MVPKTALEAIHSPGDSVAKMRRFQGDELITDVLEIMISDLVESFNIGKTMNVVQVRFTAEIIKSDYYYLKPSELAFVFNRGKRGHYGAMYDRIDAAVICDWIEQFLMERQQLLVQKNIDDAKVRQKNMLEEWSGIVEKLVKPNLEPQAEMSTQPPKQREKTEQEKIVQEVFIEFDSLYLKQEHLRTGPNTDRRFVKYGDKWLNAEEFLQAKLDERNDQKLKELKDLYSHKQGLLSDLERKEVKRIFKNKEVTAYGIVQRLLTEKT